MTSRQQSILIAAALLPAVGCQKGPHTHGAEPAPPYVVSIGDLAGTYQVSAPGEAPGTTASITRLLYIWRSCGAVTARWRASTHGGFIATENGWDGSCGNHLTYPAWVGQIRTVTKTANGLTFNDANGKFVATLTRGGTPPPKYGELPGLSPSAPTTSLQDKIEPDPVRMPGAWGAASAQQLTGYWFAESTHGGPRTVTELEFRADGTSKATNGCATDASPWTIPSNGVYLHPIGGAYALEACGPGPLLNLSKAVWVGMHYRGKSLTAHFYDIHGNVVLELHNRPTASAAK